MELDARGLLLGAGIWGMIAGAALGIAAGAAYEDCLTTLVSGPTLVCDEYATMRIAAFAFVGISAAAALVPVVHVMRNEREMRFNWGLQKK